MLLLDFILGEVLPSYVSREKKFALPSVENLLSAFLSFELLTSLIEFGEAMCTLMDQKLLGDTSILNSPFSVRLPLPPCSEQAGWEHFRR